MIGTGEQREERVNVAQGATTITQVNMQEWTVRSASGNTYTVTYRGCGDDENVNLWECTCPVARFSEGVCKHARMVSDLQDWCEGTPMRDGETFAWQFDAWVEVVAP
jgi:hypothetical protein